MLRMLSCGGEFWSATILDLLWPWLAWENCRMHLTALHNRSHYCLHLMSLTQTAQQNSTAWASDSDETQMYQGSQAPEGFAAPFQTEQYSNWPLARTSDTNIISTTTADLALGMLLQTSLFLKLACWHCGPCPASARPCPRMLVPWRGHASPTAWVT